jgi:hypothetical protein
MIKIIKNIQALSIFKQNRLSQKLSKLRVALVGAKADISDKVMVQKLLDCLGKLKGNSVCGRLAIIQKYQLLRRLTPPSVWRVFGLVCFV